MNAFIADRITDDPNICPGQPSIRGLRYSVKFILELLDAPMTIDEILTDYEDLERDDTVAAVKFAQDSAA